MTFFRSKPRTATTDTKRKTDTRASKAREGHDGICADDLERLRRRPTYFI